MSQLTSLRRPGDQPPAGGPARRGRQPGPAVDPARLGFDAAFRRMWELYLAYSEAGFRSGYLQVSQFLLTRAATAAPRRARPGGPGPGGSRPAEPGRPR